MQSTDLSPRASLLAYRDTVRPAWHWVLDLPNGCYDYPNGCYDYPNGCYDYC
jgi:hypothetical protein